MILYDDTFYYIYMHAVFFSFQFSLVFFQFSTAYGSYKDLEHMYARILVSRGGGGTKYGCAARIAPSFSAARYTISPLFLRKSI